MYLNYRQLKAARYVLNLGVADIGSLIETSRTTISKLENNVITLSEMRLSDRRNTILQEFFKKNSIVFYNNHSISLSTPHNINFPEECNDNLTRFQLRAARTILNKTQAELAKIVKISPAVIKTAESYSNSTFLNPKDTSTIFRLIDTFLKEGLTFPNTLSVDFKKIS